MPNTGILPDGTWSVVKLFGFKKREYSQIIIDNICYCSTFLFILCILYVYVNIRAEAGICIGSGLNDV